MGRKRRRKNPAANHTPWLKYALIAGGAYLVLRELRKHGTLGNGYATKPEAKPVQQKTTVQQFTSKLPWYARAGLTVAETVRDAGSAVAETVRDAGSAVGSAAKWVVLPGGVSQDWKSANADLIAKLQQERQARRESTQGVPLYDPTGLQITSQAAQSAYGAVKPVVKGVPEFGKELQAFTLLFRAPFGAVTPEEKARLNAESEKREAEEARRAAGGQPAEGPYGYAELAKLKSAIAAAQAERAAYAESLLSVDERAKLEAERAREEAAKAATEALAAAQKAAQEAEEGKRRFEQRRAEEERVYAEESAKKHAAAEELSRREAEEKSKQEKAYGEMVETFFKDEFGSLTRGEFERKYGFDPGAGQVFGVATYKHEGWQDEKVGDILTIQQKAALWERKEELAAAAEASQKAEEARKAKLEIAAREARGYGLRAPEGATKLPKTKAEIAFEKATKGEIPTAKYPEGESMYDERLKGHIRKYLDSMQAQMEAEATDSRGYDSEKFKRVQAKYVEKAIALYEKKYGKREDQPKTVQQHLTDQLETGMKTFVKDFADHIEDTRGLKIPKESIKEAEKSIAGAISSILNNPEEAQKFKTGIQSTMGIMHTAIASELGDKVKDVKMSEVPLSELGADWDLESRRKAQEKVHRYQETGALTEKENRDYQKALARLQEPPELTTSSADRLIFDIYYPRLKRALEGSSTLKEAGADKSAARIAWEVVKQIKGEIPTLAPLYTMATSSALDQTDRAEALQKLAVGLDALTNELTYNYIPSALMNRPVDAINMAVNMMMRDGIRKAEAGEPFPVHYLAAGILPFGNKALQDRWNKNVDAYTNQLMLKRLKDGFDNQELDAVRERAGFAIAAQQMIRGVTPSPEAVALGKRVYDAQASATQAQHEALALAERLRSHGTAVTVEPSRPEMEGLGSIDDIAAMEFGPKRRRTS